MTLSLLAVPGFSTAKGELVRSILFPKPVDFKFTQDAMKFVGFLASVSLIGMVYTLVLMVSTTVSTSSIVILLSQQMGGIEH